MWEQLSGSRSYFSSTNNNAIPNLNGGNNGGVRGQSYGKSEWSIMSYLARVSYNYDSKYLVTANFRADGSSKLAPATAGVTSPRSRPRGVSRERSSCATCRGSTT